MTVLRTKHIRNTYPYTTILYYCPVCKNEDNGTKMVECETCGNWCHEECVPPFDIIENWYCQSCSKT